MARFEIKMPKLGESITEGTILSWSVQVGDVVNEDDVLLHGEKRFFQNYMADLRACQADSTAIIKYRKNQS